MQDTATAFPGNIVALRPRNIPCKDILSIQSFDLECFLIYWNLSREMLIFHKVPYCEFSWFIYLFAWLTYRVKIHKILYISFGGKQPMCKACISKSFAMPLFSFHLRPFALLLVYVQSFQILVSILQISLVKPEELHAVLLLNMMQIM